MASKSILRSLSWFAWARFFVLAFILVAAASNISANDPVESGFHSLFNGRDLTGWRGAVENYHVVDGAIVCKEGKGGVLFYGEEYTDFTVRLEFLLPRAGNNGLAIRYPGYGRASVDAMCELQVLDDDAPENQLLDPRQYHGSMYGMAAAKRGYLKPVGEWNQQEVIVQGSRIRVVLNGATILDVDASTLKDFKGDTLHPGKDRRSGYFGFAGHRDPVRFRNIRVKRLDPHAIASFSADVTIPIGHRCMGVLPQKSTTVVLPLMVHGFVVLGEDLPVVVAAIDWCEIRNASYDLWRDALAAAARTTRERVLLSSVHQHDAPVVDHDAAALLDNVGLSGELFDPAFHADTLQRVSQAVRDCLDEAQPITHVGLAETRVQQVASSRRMVDSNGKISFARGSSSGREAVFRDADEGPIDPKLRTLSFWNGDRCMLEYHAYATHPMSFYGRGEITSDFPGLARDRRQRDDRSTHQIYASGCSGDVTAGKYNDGSEQAREQLANRLYEAMVAARSNTLRVPMDTFRFRCATMELEYSRDDPLQPDALRRDLHDTELPVERRILAAMGLASWQRVEQKRSIDVPCCDLGIVSLVLLPGESFVGYQAIARDLSPNQSVIPIGYGECWPGYIPTEAAFFEGFHESWMWVAPGAEGKIRSALKQVLQR